MSAFIAQSSGNLQPDYQQISALLLFDQINIQRALANGTSLDGITTSGADPTARFTPKPLDSRVNGLWFASLTLSLTTALFAVLADEWYCHYLSPVDGDPQVRSRTRQLRYTGLMEWRVSTLISLLPLMLHLSLLLFVVGLVLSLLPEQQGIAVVIGSISLATLMAYLVTNLLPLIFPECPYKTPLSSVVYAIIMWMHRQYSTVKRAVSPVSLPTSESSTVKTLKAWEIHVAKTSCMKHEVDALLWLYTRSSTSVIRHLVIHALAGLPLVHILHAKEVVSEHLWVEIRNEKERLLMDCMELTEDRHGYTRFIPKDIPNIERRIEPLLRLDSIFDPLCRVFPSGIFGEHDLDFSIKKRHFSDTFLTTLSALKDPHIVKPLDPWYGGEISMASFTDNPFHHPAVWRKIYTRPSSRGPFHSHVGGSDVQSFNPDFTSEVFLNLVTSVYFPNENYSTSSRCTLMDAAVYISQGHLGHAALFFLDGCVLKPNENYERRLLFAIIRFSLHDEDHAQSTIHSHQPPFFDNVDFKRKLFRIAIHALNKIIHLPPFEFDREVFKTIGSYIALDLFPSWDFPEYNRPSLEYECSIADALVCLASLMHRAPGFCALLPPDDQRTISIFSNILEVFQSEARGSDFDLSYSRAVRFSPFLRNHCNDINLLVMFIFGQAFSQGIPQAYEAFHKKRSLSYIADHADLHPKAIDGVTSYITGLSEAAKKKGNKNPDATFPRLYIEDLHQAKTIRSICTIIVRSGTPPRPILNSLASIDPKHTNWLGILAELRSSGDFSIKKYDFRKDLGEDEIQRLKREMMHAVDILEKCLRCKRYINWVGALFKYIHLP